jgi:hypothetical protein
MRPFFKTGLFLDKARGHSLYFGHPSDFLRVDNFVAQICFSGLPASRPRRMSSYTKKKEEDPLLDYLLKFKVRMGKAQGLLTDDNLTAFF